MFDPSSIPTNGNGFNPEQVRQAPEAPDRGSRSRDDLSQVRRLDPSGEVVTTPAQQPGE